MCKREFKEGGLQHSFHASPLILFHFAKIANYCTKSQHTTNFLTTNLPALEAFLQRTVAGLNLSDRVWRYTDAFKHEIELALDLGIRTGESAAQMTRSLRQYLQHPDKLFRRVRDRHGLLRLSQAAKAFHPGTGVYRSSYRNARRLAATETNIAYRTADHLRWQQMDFVVGIEIQLSNNHTVLLQPGERTSDPTQQRADGSPKANAVRPLTDICDELKGRYPKDFKFTGWHPHCRCRAITILKTDEELARDFDRILAGHQPIPSHQSSRAVTAPPPAFTQWLEKNAPRIEKARKNGSLPYFLRDNEERLKSTIMLDYSYSPNAMKPQFSDKNSKIADRKKLFEKLKINPNYTDVAFNESNGGIKATHVKHNLDKSKGHYETSVQNIGFQNGEIVILEEEIHSVLNQRNTEGTWNLIPFELAAAETGASQNIRNALKHCASKPNADIAVVYSLNELSAEAINEGLNRFNGLRNDPKQWKRFKEIIFIFPNGEIKKHFQK